MSQEEGGLDVNLTGTPAESQPADTTVNTQLQAAKAQLAVLMKRITVSGSWFYWIAGISLVNTIKRLAGSEKTLIFGLGSTGLVNNVATDLGGNAVIFGIAMDIIIIGVYVMFGYYACRRARWAFITGMVLYALDTPLVYTLYTSPTIPVLFHVFTLFFIYSGLKADTQARRLEAQVKNFA